MASSAGTPGGAAPGGSAQHSAPGERRRERDQPVDAPQVRLPRRIGVGSHMDADGYAGEAVQDLWRERDSLRGAAVKSGRDAADDRPL